MAQFRERALATVQEAVRLDNEGEYQKAYDTYVHALEIFHTYLKYEKNPQVASHIRAKVEEYLSRAEKLREYLDSTASLSVEAGGGGSAGAVPGASGSSGKEEADGGSGEAHRRSKEELNEFLAGRTLEDVVHERVTGQHIAVSGVCKAIQRMYEGWRLGDSPMVFMFTGPSGVGKTELAKAVAHVVLGDQDAVIRVDMSEYQEKHSVSKFLGAPQGYVGSNQGSLFAERLAANPHTVVLLDEVEKAHPDVLTIMLSVFDEGRFTPSNAPTIDCRQSIFIMTSNLGADVITSLADQLATNGLGPEEMHAAILVELEPVLKAHFKRDEFLGRIDDILPFLPFSNADLDTIIALFLRKWVKLASERGIVLQVDPSVTAYVVSLYNPKYGVRSIKSTLEKQVGNALADASARGIIGDGSAAVLHVDVATQSMVVDPVASPTLEPSGGRGGGGSSLVDSTSTVQAVY